MEVDVVVWPFWAFLGWTVSSSMEQDFVGLSSPFSPASWSRKLHAITIAPALLFGTAAARKASPPTQRTRNISSTSYHESGTITDPPLRRISTARPHTLEPLAECGCLAPSYPLWLGCSFLAHAVGHPSARSDTTSARTRSTPLLRCLIDK